MVNAMAEKEVRRGFTGERCGRCGGNIYADMDADSHLVKNCLQCGAERLPLGHSAPILYRRRGRGQARKEGEDG